jgi:hypothetical protein
MFKYKLILLSTILLFACGEQKEEVKVEENTRHNKVINHTDSLIIFANKKMNKIKKNNKKQTLFMDSLQNTIESEQYIINSLNREVKRIQSVDEDLQLTKKELETALKKCKEKEIKLDKLNKKMDLKSEKLMTEVEYYVGREFELIKNYDYTIDSLMLIIDSLKKDTIINIIKTSNKKQKNKKKNKKKNKSEKNN